MFQNVFMNNIRYNNNTYHKITISADYNYLTSKTHTLLYLNYNNMNIQVPADLHVNMFVHYGS